MTECNAEQIPGTAVIPDDATPGLYNAAIRVSGFCCEHCLKDVEDDLRSSSLSGDRNIAEVAFLMDRRASSAAPERSRTLMVVTAAKPLTARDIVGALVDEMKNKQFFYDVNLGASTNGE